MIIGKTKIEERIKELEERSRFFEEKTKQAMELLESLESEFEDLQNIVLLGPAHALGRPAMFHEKKDALFAEAKYLKPGRIDMTGTKEEEDALKEGWWQSEGNFRWSGKDNKDPVLHFSVQPGREYELGAKIFVPAALARKPIKVIANGTELADFIVDEENQVEKKIKIPSNVITDDKLKIVFKSGFWNPRDLDSKLKDERTLSLAFQYIELN